MAPQMRDGYYSSLGIKIHKNRAEHLNSSGDLWLSDKQDDDGAEGLWRVHDDLYDLTDFIKIHPGGPMWLELTKGTDITEAFEAHHISLRPVNMLKKFHVRKAMTPRNSPFTFEENGFYQTLKRNIREELPKIPTDLKDRSKLIVDLLLISYIFSAIVAARCMNYYIGTISGSILAMLTVAAHNFFHQKDNFRMYYFDMSLMSSRDWRISHALSHHLYTNTIIDLEIQMFEPLLQFLPMKKTFFFKYLSWIYSPLFYVSLFGFSFIKRIVRLLQGERKHVGKRDLVPFIVPILMYFFGGQSLSSTLLLWFYIICIGSLQFSFVGINAAHQSPTIFHDGDTPRSDKIDWGIAQLDAVMDRFDINASYFLVLTNFGEHGLHHLFPTMDHGTLTYLYPVFEKTCKDFDISLRVASQLDMVRMQFLQLSNTEPNPIPFGQKKKE